MSLITHPLNQPLRGELQPPGDKSISHRAILFSSIADGVSQVRGWLDAADTRATLNACRALGVTIEHQGSEVTVHGVGLEGLRASDQPLDLGNSGTGVRLLMGLLAGQAFTSTLSGDHSLSARPMGRVIRPLTQMGANFESSDERLPVTVHGGALQAIDYTSPVASAQVKSAILLAGLYANGATSVTEPALSRDHTERMLRDYGVNVDQDGLRVSVRGRSRLRGHDIQVPADFSSAAFFLVAASIIPGSDITLRRVGLNPSRRGLLDLLLQMGADIDIQPLAEGAEPQADLRVRHSQLRAIDVPAESVVSAIDEFPILMVAAACAEGTTRIRGAAELRVKESDRIAVMCQGLQALGIPVSEQPDGADITGGPAHAGAVAAHDDHRCAMSFAVLGAAAQGPVQISGADYIATSYPGFVADFTSLGGRLDQVGTVEDCA
ncbi:MAG: 3-phosphoshikimate 1-carboxyvinyltransferase [Wenzhouxiangellaceae bacterium]